MSALEEDEDELLTQPDPATLICLQQRLSQLNINIPSESFSESEVEDQIIMPAPPRRRRVRKDADAINKSLIKKESYTDSLQQLKSCVGEGSDGDKMQEVLNRHLEQYKNSAGEAEYDEDFLRDIASMGQTLSQINGTVTLEKLEEMERRRNLERPPERRIRETIIKVTAWHQKNTLKEMLRVSKLNQSMAWLTSFYRCDPRWQIMRFFDEVAKEGGDVPMDEHMAASPLPDLFSKASVFTVWRPTSDEAIKNMMLGVACGKGLDIKGKSAKKGNISSYVPFVQVFDGPHKQECKSYMKPGNYVRIFYQNKNCRDEARNTIREFMKAAQCNIWPDVADVDYVLEAEIDSSELFALDIEEQLFWECYVMMQNCSRPEGSEWDIGRKSLPPFMAMNMDTIRRTPREDEPRAVVYQMSKTNPMEPRMLLLAYEENGGVKPVVSDFDCFILGTRGVRYQKSIPPDQIELLQWSVKNIGMVLDDRSSPKNHTLSKAKSMKDWCDTWFDVLSNSSGYHPKPPRFGNGDPKSYEIIEVGVSRLSNTGCVRHGAECFNWFFPQEMDDEFLVISDTLSGNIKWKKVNVTELQKIMIEKIDDGFTFPLNPKWILCDPGWKRVYNKLLDSDHPNVQDSINCWLPQGSGLREQIAEISAKHPNGFTNSKGGTLNKFKSFSDNLIKLNRMGMNMGLG